MKFQQKVWQSVKLLPLSLPSFRSSCSPYDEKVDKCFPIRLCEWISHVWSHLGFDEMTEMNISWLSKALKIIWSTNFTTLYWYSPHCKKTSAPRAIDKFTQEGNPSPTDDSSLLPPLSSSTSFSCPISSHVSTASHQVHLQPTDIWPPLRLCLSYCWFLKFMALSCDLLTFNLLFFCSF